jgi:hypothetical protein
MEEPSPDKQRSQIIAWVDQLLAQRIHGPELIGSESLIDVRHRTVTINGNSGPNGIIPKRGLSQYIRAIKPDAVFARSFAKPA